MKRFAALTLSLALLSALACKVEKTGEDTYQVKAPVEETKDAAREVGQEVKEAGQAVKEGAQDIANSPAAQEAKEDMKAAGRKAADATGKALENAGEKVQEHAKPGDQP